MDFGALEGDYVADHLPYLRELQDLWKSDKPVFQFVMGSTLNRFIREPMDL